MDSFLRSLLPVIEISASNNVLPVAWRYTSSKLGWLWAREKISNFEKASSTFNFVVDKEKDLLTKLKVELAFSKFEIFSLAQSQPSLDDVYLQATGKTLLDAEISMTGKRDFKKESKQSMR